MSSPTDAAIATIAELNALSEEHGVFLIAENATSEPWISDQRQQVFAAIAKTRAELRRLESALQRLEHAATTMGRDGSTLKIEREYTPLEGWALTLMDNYAMLVAKLSRSDRPKYFGRLQDYARAVILKAKGGNATHSLKHVRDYLQDKSVLY
jgi:hypothetical protein